MEELAIWTESYRVPAYEVDLYQQARFTAVCNWLQNIAGNHADYHQMGYEGMMASGNFWALSRLKVRMLEYPIWKEELLVQTWISTLKGPFSNRHFAVLRKKDSKVLCEGSAFWVLINSDTRKPVKIGEVSMPATEDKIPTCGLAEKVRLNVMDFEASKLHTVGFRDLDMIGHVNNVKYIEWLVDAFEGDRKQWLPKTLSINYLHETHLGEKVQINSTVLSEAPMEVGYELQKEDGLACRAKMEWAKRL